MGTDDVPKNITTNTNDDLSDDLLPGSPDPWKSNPQDTNRPEITVVLPHQATITEVALTGSTNVENFTVKIINNGSETTVSNCNFIYE